MDKKNLRRWHIYDGYIQRGSKGQFEFIRYDVSSFFVIDNVFEELENMGLTDTVRVSRLRLARKVASRVTYGPSPLLGGGCQNGR